MIRYRNHNTAQVVELDEPSVRLDHLDNWERFDGPAPAPAAELKRPAKSASKAAWVAHAAALGVDPAEAEAMTRDDLDARTAEIEANREQEGDQGADL